MDISTIKSLLTTMNEVGIIRCVIEPLENDMTRVRATNKESNIVIYHDFDFSVVDYPVGIQSVPGFLSRIMLFDEEKSAIEVSDNGKIIVSAKIVQGKKEASFRFADPRSSSSMPVPSRVPGDLSIDNCIEFSEEYVKHISSVFSAMGYTGDKTKREVGMKTKGDTVTLRVSDGEYDSFTDTIETDGLDINIDGEAVWEVSPFDRLLKASLANSQQKKARFSVNAQHVGVFDLGDIVALAVPLG